MLVGGAPFLPRTPTDSMIATALLTFLGDICLSAWSFSLRSITH